MQGTLDDVKRRILRKVPLAELIGAEVRLTAKAGQSLGCCPFHAEKTPSFYVYDDHYHCFGCKAHGDAITYVRQREGLGYVEALRLLAGKYNVEAPELEQSRGRRERSQQDATLYRMMLEAQELFVQNLNGPQGGEALAYLQNRGFTPESIKSFGFGLTPHEGYGLVKHLRGRGFGEDAMIACSLAKISERNGRPFDFFRARVMLPIHDGSGRLVAFGGRTVDGSQPKYMNSGDSALFDKGQTLYGFDRARKVMRERGRAIVTEGYMDTLQLWQAGYPEAVACLGTAFGEAHLRLLGRATNVVYLLLDGDRAGQDATLKSVSVALAVPSVQVRAATLPAGMDPDDFIRKEGGAALEQILASAVDLLDFVVRERLRTTHALGVPEMVGRELIPWLARVTERIQRDFLVNRIGLLTGIPAASLMAQLRDANAAAANLNAGKAPERGPGAEAQRPVKPSQLRAEVPLPPLPPTAAEVFGHVYHASPGELDVASVRDDVARSLELEPEYETLLAEFLICLENGQAPSAISPGEWAARLGPATSATLTQLASVAKHFACNDRGAALRRLWDEIRRRQAKAQIAQLKAEIPRLAADPERKAELAQLLLQISELARSAAF